MHAFDRWTDKQTDRYRQKELAFNIITCALKIICGICGKFDSANNVLSEF